MVTIVKAWDKGMSITRDATLSVFKIMKNASIKDETLHNRFEEIVKKTFTREDDRAYMLAYFDLLRTTRSDTSWMMQLLRSDGPYMQQLFRPTTYSAGLNILSLTCLLARKSVANGRRSDAIWVLDHVYDRAPYLLSGGSGLRSFKAKVQGAVANFSKRPSKAELKRADLVLDKDGNLMSRDEALRNLQK